MQETRNLTVNGVSRLYSPGMTVSALLAEVCKGNGAVVVEVNGEIISRERFAETPLTPGDIIEIVHFVGGG